jgi:hypothetical protein
VALTIVTQSQAQLSLQQHLDIAPDILNCPAEDLEGELQPLMMAQAVPNPPNEKKRVKVYELRNNDWFDRGTGFCTATFVFVCIHSRRLRHLNKVPCLSALWCRTLNTHTNSYRHIRMKEPARKNLESSYSRKNNQIAYF